MKILDCLEAFNEVAKGLNFKKAAERLGVSRSVVTKRVAWLEQTFEAQLFLRNTRNVSLTESGVVLLKNIRLLPDSIAHLKDLVSQSSQKPMGRLRVGAPPSFGATRLAPMMQQFAEQHPTIQCNLILDDGRTDLIEENLDLSIRIAPKLQDSSQIAYKVAVVPQVLVATTSYLNRFGRPENIEDLNQHNCLIHNLKSPTGIWKLTDNNGGVTNIQVTGTISSNIGESLLQLACRDYGISMHPIYMVAQLIEEQKIEIVLPSYYCEGLDIYAVVQSKRYLPKKTRLFLDFLRANYGKTCSFAPPPLPRYTSPFNK